MNYDEIEQQYKENKEILAKQYPFPGFDDNTQLLQWLKSVEFLNTNAQAYIASIPYNKLLKKKTELGIHIPRKTTHKIVKKQHILQLPKNWRTKEVLTELLKDYTAHDVSIAAKTPLSDVTYLCFKHKIKYGKPALAHNPCSNFKWCHHYYITLNLTLDQCSELANTSRTTFRKWLLTNNIPIKKHTPIYRQYRPWVDILKNNISNIDIIDNIIVTDKCITLRYRNPISKFYPSIESYYFDTIDTDTKWTTKYKKILKPVDSIYNSMAKILYEYGSVTDINLENAYPSMVKISRKDFNSKTLIEQRISINNMIYYLISRGWMNPAYPEELLKSEFDYLKNVDLSTHTVNGVLRTMPKGYKLLKKYKQIPFHFFDLSRLWRIMRKPLKLRSVINRLANGIEDITYTAILKSFLYESGLKIPVPTLYAAIFKKLGVKSILDVSPGYGSKAMACAILDIKYVPRRTHAIEHAINNGFAEFIGLDYEWFDENNNKKYDLMIGTDIFTVGLSMIKKYKNYAKNIMAFVRKESKDELEILYKPTSIIPIIMKVNGEVDYIFLW